MRVDPEIERELAFARGEEAAKHRPEARALAELRVSLTDHREIGKRVERLAVRAVRWTDQSPLLHVAEVILAQMLVAPEQLAAGDRG